MKEGQTLECLVYGYQRSHAWRNQIGQKSLSTTFPSHYPARQRETSQHVWQSIDHLRGAPFGFCSLFVERSPDNADLVVGPLHQAQSSRITAHQMVRTQQLKPGVFLEPGPICRTYLSRGKGRSRSTPSGKKPGKTWIKPCNKNGRRGF